MEKLPEVLPAPSVEVSSAPSRSRRLILVAIGAVLAVIALAWWQLHGGQVELREQVARRLAESDSRQQEGRTLAKADHDALQALQGKVGALEAKLAETQSQAVALEAMYQDMVRGRDERLLAEVEQALAIAAQQLQLAGNVEAALIALRTADARLANSSQTRFVPLRRLIARDLERLKGLPLADVTGLSLKIEGVAAVVDSLPLAFEQRPGNTPRSARADKVTRLPDDSQSTVQGLAQRLIADVWQEMKQLIRIQRVENADPALLAPNQVYFLRENLRLRLLGARLALLQRDAKTYRADLGQVRDLLQKYHDGGAPAVQTALATVKKLAEADISVELPTLNETLNAARTLKLLRDKAN